MQENANNFPGKNVICFTNDSWSSALSEIRLKAPLQACGFNVVQGNDFDKLLVDDLSKADFIVIQRDFPIYLDIFFHILKQIKKYNLPLIYEIDDHLFDLPQDHPDQQMGCYSSRFTPMLLAICTADMVTASTEPLAKFLRAFNSNVKVLQNCLIDKYWRLSPIKKNKNAQEDVVIGYIGGTTHAADLKMIAGALQSIGQQHGRRIKFKFWGAKPPEEILSHPKVDWQPVVASYQEYALAFQSQDIDILIAPLIDNSFSQSKSHLKFLEYSTLGIPGIYSDVTPYRNIVKHGENGFLASSDEEWVECLQNLISSPDLRYRISQNAQDTVKRDWLLSERANRWSNSYNNVRAGPLKSQVDLDAPSITQNDILHKILSLQADQIGKLVEKERILVERERLLAEKEWLLHEIINSSSWRITDPFRRFADEIRKIKQKIFLDHR